MHIKIGIILCIYILFFVINFGIVLAYLQKSGDTKFNNWITNYTYAIVASLPGFFGTIGIMVHCLFPKYGWTLIPTKSNHWNNTICSITKKAYKSIWD